MTLKENLQIIIEKETKNILSGFVVSGLVKKILSFRDEWNLVVKQQNFHIEIGDVDCLNEKDCYRITVPRYKKPEIERKVTK